MIWYLIHFYFIEVFLIKVVEHEDSYHSTLESDNLDFFTQSYAQNTGPISETPTHL